MAVDGAICQDPVTKAIVSEALKNKMESLEILICTEDSQCRFDNFDCVYDPTESKTTLSFTLEQTSALVDQSIITKEMAR